MNITFTIKSLSVRRGGAERVLSILSSELVKMGHKISIITFDSPNDKFVYEFNENITFYKIGNEFRSPNLKTSLFDFFHRTINLRKVLKKVNPDIVVGFMSSSFTLLPIALFLTNIKFICSEHIVPEYYKDRKLEFFLVLLSSFFAVKFIVISEEIKILFPRIVKRKIKSITNPVYLPNIKCKNELPEKVILSVGRLAPQKDHETLIRAFRIFIDEHPGWLLKIIGDGELRSHISKLIAELKLEKFVLLEDEKVNIQCEYKTCSFLVNSAKFESFGMVTVEGMFYGKPTIGFVDCPGTNEVIKNEINGVLVDNPNRVHGLYSAMSNLVNDYQLYEKLSKNCIEASKEFSKEAVAYQWESLLHKALK